MYILKLINYNVSHFLLSCHNNFSTLFCLGRLLAIIVAGSSILENESA
jgi:hypothetical protein